MFLRADMCPASFIHLINDKIERIFFVSKWTVFGVVGVVALFCYTLSSRSFELNEEITRHCIVVFPER